MGTSFYFAGLSLAGDLGFVGVIYLWADLAGTWELSFTYDFIFIGSQLVSL